MNNGHRYHQSLVNRLSELQNLQTIISQINQLRIPTNSTTVENYPKTFHDSVTSSYVLLLTPLIILLFLFCLFLELNNIKHTILTGEFELTVKSLETNHFFILYFISFVLIFAFFWALYLLMYKIICSFETISIDSITLKQEDILYFNPCFFCVSMIFYNTIYLTTFFDIFFLLSYSSIIFINFIFSKYGTYYFNQKISAITNFYSKETSKILIKIILFYSGMILTNIAFMILIGLILPWDQVEYSLLVLFRNIYLLLHQIQMCCDIWWKYKQLDSGYCTDEKRFIKNQYSQLTIETIIQVAVIQQLFFVNMKLYHDAVYLVVLSWSVILRGVVGIITIGVKFYELSAFLTNLELK